VLDAVLLFALPVTGAVPLVLDAVLLIVLRVVDAGR
jgi:hypothetical protein